MTVAAKNFANQHKSSQLDSKGKIFWRDYCGEKNVFTKKIRTFFADNCWIRN